MVVKKNELKKMASEILAMKPGIIALEGPLGAGKTTLVKALAKELRIDDDITSPTFVLHHRHQITNHESGITHLDHIDCWRMESGGELEQLGFEKMLDPGSLIVIEWADQVRDTILKYKDRAKIVWMKFEYSKKENERLVSWEVN